jgi:hypothetical protein
MPVAVWVGATNMGPPTHILRCRGACSRTNACGVKVCDPQEGRKWHLIYMAFSVTRSSSMPCSLIDLRPNMFSLNNCESSISIFPPSVNVSCGNIRAFTSDFVSFATPQKDSADRVARFMPGAQNDLFYKRPSETFAT